MITGEACKRWLRAGGRSLPQAPLFTRLADLLIYRFDRVDEARLWTAVEEQVPVLYTTVCRLLADR